MNFSVLLSLANILFFAQRTNFMKKILNLLISILPQTSNFPTKTNLFCAVSSGQDSVLLFILLLHVQNKLDFQLQVIYCQHFWQLKNFISGIQIWHLTFIFQTPFYLALPEKVLINENRSRIWRQIIFYRAALLSKSTKILLGHTSSDRFETALWNLMRGTSPKGITRLNEKNEIKQKFLPNLFSCLIFSVQKEEQNQSNLSILPYQSKKSKKVFTKKVFFVPEFFCSDSIFSIGFTQAMHSFIGPTFFPLSFVKVTHQGILLDKCNTCLLKNTNQINFDYKLFVLKNYQNSYTFSFYSKNYYKSLFLLRPLFHYHRNDILNLNKLYNLPIITDKTNKYNKFTRNRIRYKLVPALTYLFDANLQNRFTNFFVISQQQQHYFRNINTKYVAFFRVNSNLKKSADKKPFLPANNPNNKKIFTCLPKTVQTSILEQIFQNYSNTQLNSRQLEKLRKRITMDDKHPFFQ